MSTAAKLEPEQFVHAQREVEIGAVIPSPTNPRKTFDKGALEELTVSVRKHGILQPLLLRPWPPTRRLPKEVLVDRELVEGEGDLDWYELVAGERRHRAAKAAGLLTVPAMVRDLGDNEVLEIQLIENLQRSDLHPLEEAEGFRQLMAAGHDLSRLAERIGRSTTYIYDRAKLLSLVKEAQQLFTEDRITTGHAILLSRLAPSDQRRAIDKDKGGVFTNEHLLWDPREAGKGAAHEDAVKPKSVRELQAWIDEHVKFDVTNPDIPDLFPLAHEDLKAAEEKYEEVIPITLEHYVQPDARDGKRVYGPRSWKEVRKSKPCEYSATGVIVVGPGRSETLRVCVEKKRCTVHWGAELKASKKRANEVAKSGGKADADERYKLQEQKRLEENKRIQEESSRWKKAAPAILKAVAAAVKAAPAKAGGQLAEILIKECLDWRGHVPAAAGLVPRGTSAEDLVRHAAFLVLAREVMDDYQAPREFPKRAKALGLDIAKILEEAAPAPKPAPKAKAAKKAGKGAKGPESRCRECNCTEEMACPQGCSWVEASDPKTGLGLCSACAPPKPAKPAKAKKR